MNLFAVATVGVVLGAAASGVAMALVEQRADTTTGTAVLSEDMSARQCALAVPPEAMQTLGILAQPGLTGRNECEVALGSRDILVSRRPLLSGGSAADLPVAARQAFEIACGLLADDTSDVERAPAWLGSAADTCARTPVDGKGISEVVLLTDAHSLVEIRVLQLDLPDLAPLHEGLAGLVAAAEVVW
ncbi:hypothetical protein [Nocardioides sp.]|uniref:hypothetical protein n=1 Tax=Nocardioides sp. TaxID=35761 RepID=UPI00286A4532|nr:hypothetical protein [Nocardioides sp.]